MVNDRRFRGELIVGCNVGIKACRLKTPELSDEKIQPVRITRPHRHRHIVGARFSDNAAGVQKPVVDVEVKVNSLSHGVLLGKSGHLMQKHH